MEIRKCLSFQKISFYYKNRIPISKLPFNNYMNIKFNFFCKCPDPVYWKKFYLSMFTFMKQHGAGFNFNPLIDICTFPAPPLYTTQRKTISGLV